jgi:hypothetical protein
MRALGSIVVLAALLAVACVPRSTHIATVPFDGDGVVIVGTLAHHRLSNDLFRIDRLWMRVEPDTLFHRWLLDGAGRVAAIGLTTDPGRFADVPNVRILTGRLIHQTAPTATPLLHVLFLEDPLSGFLGPITFETQDPIVAHTFDRWADAEVSVIVEIRTP